MLLMKANSQETDQECVLCGQTNYVDDGTDIVCPECFHTPLHETKSPSETQGPWEHFDRLRADYSGLYGPERVKMVGGFARAYDFDEDF